MFLSFLNSLFFEKVSNFRNRILTNQKHKLVVSSCRWNCMNKLNFEKHVTALCKKASFQLNALSHRQRYTGFQEMKMLLDIFILLIFNYFPLVWHFCSAAFTENREIQECALRLLYNDSYSSYNSLLLKAELPTMERNRLRILAIEL